MKVCGKPGCPNLTATAYCDEHAPAAWASSTRRQHLPPDWEQRRVVVLERDGYRCQLRYAGCTGAATDVDHRHRGDDHSIDNLQAACPPCHRRKTLAEAAAARGRGTTSRRR